MSERSDLAAGLLFGNGLSEDPAVALSKVFTPSAIWQSGFLPLWLHGRAAYGRPLPRWAAPPDERERGEDEYLDQAWKEALPRLDPESSCYLRVQVDTVATVRQLREFGAVDGLRIVPSLVSRGRHRDLHWRWPLRVGIVEGPSGGTSLDAVQGSSHHGRVYVAEPFDANSEYEFALIEASDLAAMATETAAVVGSAAACVIVHGDGEAEADLMALQERVAPTIAVAVAGPPSLWWWDFFHTLAHDVPVDAVVEDLVALKGVDALLAGPRLGMDVTAPARWFAAVAPGFSQLRVKLHRVRHWDWHYEDGGSTNVSRAVDRERSAGGDPVAVIWASTGPGPGYPQVVDHELEFEEKGGPEAEPDTADERRLVARVLDGERALTSALPPNKELIFAVRIAVPEPADIGPGVRAPVLPDTVGPTAVLDVVVTGSVWQEQPGSQKISVSRVNLREPSSWAAFAFTTPQVDRVVTIKVLVLFRGKPLRSAIYEAPVRTFALPGELIRPIELQLSGPDQPTEELRPVDVTLDGTGAELVRVDTGRKVVINVQGLLDLIDDRVSTDLGVPGAPGSFDEPNGLQLLIKLARLGSELHTMLEPLDIGEEHRRVNVVINPGSLILPLEVAYAAPSPADGATLCSHDQPPPPGLRCTAASKTQVCPYAFWGLYRSIARTVQSGPRDAADSPPWTSTISTASVLYGASVIADDGSVAPLPSDVVLADAELLFRPVTRVADWSEWRRAVAQDKPNLLVILGHTLNEGGTTNLYIGKRSWLARDQISASELVADGSGRPLLLLIACASGVLGDPLGSLPGTLTAKGAGAVVATLSRIIGPHGATATTHLLRAVHALAGQNASVGDAVQGARRSLIAERRPIGLVLVSHGELDTRLVH